MADKTLEQRFEELEKRVRVYEDIEQIKQLSNRYQDAVVAGDIAVQKTCFTDDAVHEVDAGGHNMVREGKEQIFNGEAPQSERIDKFLRDFTEIIIQVHPRITVDGDKATGNWTQWGLIVLKATKHPAVINRATCEHEYERRNGEWKIKRFRARLDFGLPPPELPDSVNYSSDY